MAERRLGHNVAMAEEQTVEELSESVGSGLEGLRDRIEAIGGKFEVDSPPGRGTRITATIPAAAAAV